MCQEYAPSRGFFTFTSPKMKLPPVSSFMVRFALLVGTVGYGHEVAFAGRGKGGDEVVRGTIDTA